MSVFYVNLQTPNITAWSLWQDFIFTGSPAATSGLGMWVHVTDFLSNINFRTRYCCRSVYQKLKSKPRSQIYLIPLFAFRGHGGVKPFFSHFSRDSTVENDYIYTPCSSHTSPYELCHSPQDCFLSCWVMSFLNQIFVRNENASTV